jgi:hypothetical protein
MRDAHALCFAESDGSHVIGMWAVISEVFQLLRCRSSWSGMSGLYTDGIRFLSRLATRYLSRSGRYSDTRIVDGAELARHGARPRYRAVR